MMTREESCSRIHEAIDQFDFSGDFLDFSLYGNGHINDTFLIHFRQADESVRPYILQRINHEVFQHPDELMENIEHVTSFVHAKLVKLHRNADREGMTLIPLKNGNYYYKDSIGSYWRAYLFIDHAVSLDIVEKPDQFYQSAVAFGTFQQMLSDFPASTLHEVIPQFHDTYHRYQQFEKALSLDICHRADQVSKEISFIQERKSFTTILNDALESGILPLRVTHNDTKLNNVMLDEVDQTPVCVIDLDTVMPGLSVTDFGDSIRFGANRAAEDEKDLSKVQLDLNLFELYTKGFLSGCGGKLTSSEISMLCIGAKMMTLECGIRFLTDYLEGDVYFRTAYSQHNLIRCRTQLKLVAEMELHWQEMEQIVEKYR